MKYKVYICEKGYKKIGEYNKDDMFFLLDQLILVEHKTDKILVIEYDESLDMDCPYLLFNGNEEEYKLIKEVKLYDEYTQKSTKRTI